MVKNMIRSLMSTEKIVRYAVVTASIPLLSLIPTKVNSLQRQRPTEQISLSLFGPSIILSAAWYLAISPNSIKREHDHGCNAMIINWPSNHSLLFDLVDR